MRRWGLAFFLMGVIFIFSSIPSDEMPDFGSADLTVKKLGHMAGYALLANAFLFALGPEKPGSFWAAWGLTVLYALSDELHQSFVPGRNASWIDVGIDSVGALLGLMACLIFLKRRALRESQQA